MTISTSSSNIQILDYSKSQLVTIDNGQAKIQDATFRLIHFIDLGKYEQFLTEIYDEITGQIPKNNLLYPVLKHETIQTFEILNTLKSINDIKRKRSIDILGTAWKFLAGSPDHEDLNIITNNLDNLNENDDKQVVINNVFEKRINNITGIVNKMLNTIRKDDSIVMETIVNLQNKIRLIKEELINIGYAIQWAKSDIINSVLLSKEEIEFSISKLKKENVPFTSAEEALRLAKINVLSKEMKIIYIIKIPLTLSETFKGINVRPVKKMNNIIIETKYKEILKGKDKLYGIKNKCETYNDFTNCRKTDVTDITNDLCISRIINGLNSTCNTTNDHHIPTIEKINKGVILLNKFSGKIETGKMAQEINGTHVVIFYNTTIRINNKEYSNIEVMPITSIPAILQPTPLEKDHIEILSLESLKDLHINNTHRINSLRKATLSIGG